MFRGSVKNTGYPLHSPVSPSIRHVPRKCEEYWLPTPFAIFPFNSPPVRHRVPSHFNWTLPPCLEVDLTSLCQFSNDKPERKSLCRNRCFCNGEVLCITFTGSVIVGGLRDGHNDEGRRSFMKVGNEGKPKLLGIVKKKILFEILEQVCSLNHPQSTPPATECNDPSTAPLLETISKIMSEYALKGR